MKLTNLIATFMLCSIATTPLQAKNDKHDQLPPGLQKKVQRGQALPPGWQMKLSKGQVIEREVYKKSEIVVPVDKNGLLTIRLDGKLVKLYEATREIVEVLERK